MIYVDKLRWFGLHRWCHMVTDGPIDELHIFANRIGLKREWFQEKSSTPHYDLTTAMRERAVKAGASEISDRALVKLIAELRAKRNQQTAEMAHVADQKSEI